MAENKIRSKSIGRAPSKNFKSLDAFKSKVLKHVGKEYLNVESDEDEPIDIAVVDCKVKKMSTLGELSSELEKKKIDGDNLDRIMKELFTHYNTEQDKIDNIVSERFLMLNTCRNHKDLYPPINLKTTNKTVDLDKLNKLQRVFQNIPIFTNDKNYTIRELLNGMNNIVENLGFQISESEYELILNQKLSPRVKSAVRGYKHDNLKGLFANLLNIYDSSESHHEAFSALVSQKNKFNNLHDFMEENLEKLLDFLDSYEVINQGEYPPLPKLVDFIYKFRTEIDAHMAKTYKGSKYNFAQTNESDNEIETGGRNQISMMTCAVCKKTNHSTDNCFKTKTCEVCNNNGHIGKYCKLKKTCQKCGKSGHVSASCFVRCRLCNSPAHGSVNCDLYPGLEPSQVECHRCANKLFIKLYHPQNKCASFPKN